MKTENITCSIKHLKLVSPNSNKLNDKFIFTSLITPFQTNKFTSIKPKTLSQTNKKIKIKFDSSITDKEFSYSKKRFRNIYNTIFVKSDLNKNKQFNSIFPKINFSKEKINLDKINNAKKSSLADSIFKNKNSRN